MSMPGFYYSIQEIEDAVAHLQRDGEHNRQADDDPELAAIVEELRQARQAKKKEEDTV